MVDIDGVPLTGKQRDFLASYSNEVVVWVQDFTNDGEVLVYANGELDEAHRSMWIPPEGFLSQPGVRLHDPEDDLDHLPTTEEAPMPTRDEVRTHNALQQLPMELAGLGERTEALEDRLESMERTLEEGLDAIHGDLKELVKISEDLVTAARMQR